MELQKGYEVVRFIEQGDMTRIKMDYLKGTILLNLLQENNRIEKKILYQWIESLVTQVCLFLNSQKNQCYRYLSPESILVTVEGKLYLLDLEAESNAFVMRNMQKREMRQHFMKKEIHFKQNMKLETDLYSLGKTIQFLLSQVQLDFPLTRKEERKLNQFIQKCLGNNSHKTYHNLKQIQKEIPKYKKKTGGHKWVACILLLALISTGVIFAFLKCAETQKYVSDSQKTVERKMKAVDTTSEEKEDLITRLQTYLQNHTTEDNYRIIEEGEEAEKQLVGYLAAAFDREEKYEKAIFYYQIMTHLETNPNELEILYLRMATIEEQLQMYDEARITYQEALKVCPQNTKIGIQYLTFICKYDTENVERQNQELTKLLLEFKELEDTEEYKKLSREYGIKTEEEKVWMEKENGSLESLY